MHLDVRHMSYTTIPEVAFEDQDCHPDLSETHSLLSHGWTSLHLEEELNTA